MAQRNRQVNERSIRLVALVLGLAGVGLLGNVDLAHRVEAGAQQFLLALAIAATHSLDDVIKRRCIFLLFLFHTDYSMLTHKNSKISSYFKEHSLKKGEREGEMLFILLLIKKFI